jgi:hypothetical protein
MSCSRADPHHRERLVAKALNARDHAYRIELVIQFVPGEVGKGMSAGSKGTGRVVHNLPEQPDVPNNGPSLLNPG